MGKVNMNINGRAYALGCEDGEEERLMRLGQKLDERVVALAKQFGQGGDLRLMVMAGIILLDEMDEINTSVDAEVGRRIGSLQTDHEKLEKALAKTEERAASELNAAAERVERMIAMLGQSED